MPDNYKGLKYFLYEKMEQCHCFTKEGSGPRCHRHTSEGKAYCWQHVDCKFPVPKPEPTVISEEPIAKIVNVKNPPKKAVTKKPIQQFERLPTKDFELINELEWDMTLNPSDYREHENYFNMEVFDRKTKKYRGLNKTEQERFEEPIPNLQHLKIENPITLEYEKKNILLPREPYDKFLMINNKNGISLLDIFLTVYDEINRITSLIYQDFSEAQFKYLFFRGFKEVDDKNGVHYSYIR